MQDKLESKWFPWLNGRESPNAKPKYKIIARCMSLSGDSIVMLHEAGSDYVINYNIRDLVTHQDIMSAMDKKESDLLRWVVTSEITNPLQSK